MKSVYCHRFCLFVVLNLLQISTSDLQKKSSCVGLTSLVSSHFVRRTTYKSSDNPCNEILNALLQFYRFNYSKGFIKGNLMPIAGDEVVAGDHCN